MLRLVRRSMVLLHGWLAAGTGACANGGPRRTADSCVVVGVFKQKLHQLIHARLLLPLANEAVQPENAASGRLRLTGEEVGEVAQSEHCVCRLVCSCGIAERGQRALIRVVEARGRGAARTKGGRSEWRQFCGCWAGLWGGRKGTEASVAVCLVPSAVRG